MSSTEVSALITLCGFIASVISAAFIAGYRWGSVKVRLDQLERQVPHLASGEQLAGVKEDLAEIKGMFQMVPRQLTHDMPVRGSDQ